MQNKYESEIIPIEENRLYFLFRRGKEEHIKALYEKGEIYINSIDFIRKCDENEERSDVDDGISYRNFFGEATIKMCNVGDDIEKDGFTLKTDNLVLKQDNEVKGNIYCLTGIYSEDLMGERAEIRHKTQSFGESLILIYNPKIFLERIFAELQKLGYTNYRANKVLYYGNEYSGKVDFFRKHEKFKPQKEFRIFIPNEENQPIKLNIGSLSDIAKVNNGVLKLTYTDEKEQLIYIKITIYNKILPKTMIEMLNLRSVFLSPPKTNYLHFFLNLLHINLFWLALLQNRSAAAGDFPAFGNTQNVSNNY